MRERGSHEPSVPVTIQSKEHVPELMSQYPSEGTRIDLVRDIGDVASIPVAIDRTSDLLGPQRDAARSEAHAPQTMVVTIASTPVDHET